MYLFTDETINKQRNLFFFLTCVVPVLFCYWSYDLLDKRSCISKDFMLPFFLLSYGTLIVFVSSQHDSFTLSMFLISFSSRKVFQIIEEERITD